MLQRGLSYLSRLCIASRNLGWSNGLKVFRAVRRNSSSTDIFVGRLKRRISFRNGLDKGVLSHFYYPQTRIHDRLENPVRVIVDAGANIGIESIRLRHFFPQAKILSIEAEGGNFVMLQANVESDPNNLCLKAGVWGFETDLKVVPGVTNEAFSVEPVESGGEVKAVTMNTILEKVGGEIDILKMDIEGAEYEVFGSNTDWVNHVKAIIIECPDSDHPGASQRIFRALDKLPFDTFVSGENLVFIRSDTGWTVETTPYL